MMNQGRNRLKRAFKMMLNTKQDRLVLIPALMGAYVNGQKTIVVAGREDFIWCRIRGHESEVVQSLNEVVGQHYDLPILIYRDPNAPDIYKVYGRDVRQYADWGGLDYSTRPHGKSHSFGGGQQGYDPVWVYKSQFMPMLPRPTASGSLGIWIEPEFYYFGEQYHWWPGSGTSSLAGYKPTGAFNAKFITVYIDSDGNPNYLHGEEFGAYETVTDYGDYIPLPLYSEGVPITAIFLLTGTERIGWGEIFDLRYPLQAVPATGSNMFIFDDGLQVGAGDSLDFEYGIGVAGPTGSVFYIFAEPPITGTFVLWDEEVILGSVTDLKVKGDNVEAGITGTTGYIYVTGSAGSCDPPITGSFVLSDGTSILGSVLHLEAYGQIGAAITGSTGYIYDEPPITGSIIIFDELSLLGSVLGINFTGDNVQVIISGSYAHVMVTGTSGGAGASGLGVVVWDDGVFCCTGTILNFRNQLQSSCSGNVAAIDVEPPVTGSVVVYDEGELLGSALGFNFIGDTVEAVLSGTVAHIMHTGSAGGSCNPPVTGSILLFDENILLGSVLGLNFTGDNIEAVISGSYGHVMVTGSAGGGGGGTPVTVSTGTFYTRELLYEVELSSATGTISFPNIPQTYDHLEILYKLRDDRSADNEDCVIYFNQDNNAANYSNGRHRAGAAHESNDGAGAAILVTTGDTADPNEYAQGTIRIQDYTVTGTRTAAYGYGGQVFDDGEALVTQNFVEWEHYEALDEIWLQTALGNDFVAGSKIQVFGLKETVLVTSVTGDIEVPVTGTFVLSEDGVVLGSVDQLEVDSDCLEASITGTIGYLDCAAPLTGTFVLYSENTLLGSVDTLVIENSDYLVASITGTIGFLSIGDEWPSSTMKWWIEMHNPSGSSTAFNYNASQVGDMYGCAGNIGQPLYWWVPLRAGTYRHMVVGTTANSRGKWDWYIDGVQVIANQDWYSAGLVYNVVKINTDIEIMFDGVHEIAAICVGKHASSSGYDLCMSFFMMNLQGPGD